MYFHRSLYFFIVALLIVRILCIIEHGSAIEKQLLGRCELEYLKEAR
jgi:hypothetical protein